MLGCYADESERIASYNDGKKHIVFPNGSRILFRYCDNDKDALRFQGRRWTCCSWTRRRSRARRRWRSCAPACEGERFPEARLLHLQPRRRGARMGQETVHRQALQGGRGAGGAQLHTVADNGQHGTDGGRPAIHKAAEALPPSSGRVALRELGDIRGAVLRGLQNRAGHESGGGARREPDGGRAAAQRRWVHVIEPFDLNAGSCRGWRIMRSYDFGYGKPFSLRVVGDRLRRGDIPHT